MDNDSLVSRLSFHQLRSPARMSIMGFALLIAMGTALLMLPASAAGPPLGFVDALFMSTSASCVTGLSTGITDTLTPFGRVTIAVLMFVGRLGPMVIALAVSRERINRFQFAEENIMIG